MAHTVLIVDDHPSFRATARILLEAEGFTVIGEAVDGATAVTETCRLRPEVVLLDVQLPDTDGFHVAEAITAHPDAPAVILVSSRDSSDFGPLVSRSGARGFVPKAELSGERVEALLVVPSLRRALAGIAILGVLVGAIVAVGILDSDHVEKRGLNARLALVIGWSFLGAGLYAWWRRPDNRFGALMTAISFAWFLSLLAASNSSVGFTIGILFAALYLAVLVQMLLAYPSGRLETRAQVGLVWAGYLLATLGQIPALLWGDNDYFECPKCPEPLTHVRDDGDLVRFFDVITMVAAAIAIGAVLVILVQRWRARLAAAAARDGAGPVVRVRAAGAVRRRPGVERGRRSPARPTSSATPR